MANRDNKLRKAFRPRRSLDRHTHAALDILASFSQVLEIVDIDAVLEFVVQRTRAIFASDAAAILLLSDEGGWLAPRATAGLSGGFSAQRVPLSPADMLREHTDDMGAIEADGWGSVALARAEGLQRALSAPLFAEGIYLGALQVYTRHHSFSRDDHTLLAALARYAAQAIANARRHGSEQLIKRDLEHAYSELLTTLTELERAQQRLLRTERLRTLGELASSVAHDFNNLLTGILGNAQILLAETDGPQRQLLEVIEQAALDGRAMVRRLQDFTNKPTTVAPRALIDIASVIDGALAITRPRWLALARHGIEIAVRRDVRGALLVLGNAPELREVLINLLVNAIDAMPRGGTLCVSAMLTAEGDAPAVVLEVSDSGIGIAPALQSEIFEPFFTTKPVEEGSGLGLAICKSIIEHHGGTIAVESSVGTGARFRITLPEAG
jgi:signal transduction histidine kinase